MMSKILNVVIILIVIAGAAYGYYLATKPGTDGVGPAAADSTSGAVSLDENGMPLADGAMTLAEQDPFVQLLAELNTITIDTQFLESGTLLSFVDYTRALRSDAVGRDNPFAPPGAGSAPPTTVKKSTETNDAIPPGEL